jgi:hypothetical protein
LTGLIVEPRVFDPPSQRYDRAYGSEEAKADPFAIHIDQDPTYKELYLEQEQHDGYHRDMNPFSEDMDIEDDMSVLVRYKNEATMTYHLTAYSPWEGEAWLHSVDGF